ncbi:bifunctional aldolase/short-chain dehydrogenase [Oricola sp.]|uniref:bifunctional aldolase/short-chain dehydrogenase n=1 Tax=Oricola sp. TaxID=1979950 RepID=UPI003BAC52E0
MRENNWNDSDAQSWVSKAAADAADRDLALRVYSSRLIGSDPDLVMHGGGNTSVKVERANLMGKTERVLHIKGSGWDLDTIEAPGMPGVWLDPLLDLRALDELSDEDMVNVQRSLLMHQSSPNPSVETLLHAYLPHKYVDHTHATAFLILANLDDPEGAIREIFGTRMAVVPYVMPGFALAKKAAEVFEASPDCEGIILLKHGHFTFGATAQESYDRVIEHTNMVEAYLMRETGRPDFECTVSKLRPSGDDPVGILPHLRGSVARIRGEHHGTAPRPVVLDTRCSAEARAFAERDDLDALGERGCGSPDHVIRTKGSKLVLPGDSSADETDAAVRNFADRYRQMFEEQNARVGGGKIMLEPHPVVAWVKGLGIVGMGASDGAASIAADLAEQTVEVMSSGEALGGFRPIGTNDLFDMEYWSLEQAKLAKASPKRFAGHVVAVTGGAGGIGFATAKAFAALGATIAIVDRAPTVGEAATKIGANCLGVEADLTSEDGARSAIRAIVARFGGLDIVVSNAGNAVSGNIVTMDEKAIRDSFELNFFAHLKLAREAAKVLAAQGTGGQLLFNASKQAVNPGKGFGAYGMPKAATMFLVRQLALELGNQGIRVNGVNADRIRSGLLTDDFIKTRADARGVTVDDYMAGNLLKKEVLADHVAQAFVALATSERTTAHITTVDGGNIEASLR